MILVALHNNVSALSVHVRFPHHIPYVIICHSICLVAMIAQIYNVDALRYEFISLRSQFLFNRGVLGVVPLLCC